MPRQSRSPIAKSASRNKTRRRPAASTMLQRAVALAEPLEARVLLSVKYVDPNPTIPGPRNGSDWTHAYADLAPVLNSAVSGDVIRVADGTYKPSFPTGTGRSVTFTLKNNVALYGGYAGYGASDPNARDVVGTPSILSGDIGTIGVNTDNTYHVVIGSGTNNTAVLDGFTITGGNANGSTSPTYLGGGMYNSAGSPTLTNCTFSGNAAYSSGGGIYNSSSSPTLTNCRFSGNSATGTSSYGAGMYNTSSSSPTLTNCTFSGNTVSNGYGGGMYNSSSSPTLTNCTFSGNSAPSSGGMYNSTSNPKLTNCIIWGSGSSPIYNSSGSPVITYSDIQGGYTGTGNINADPLFVRSPWTGPDGAFCTADDDYGDLRLRIGSPVLNIGSNAAIPTGVTTDLAGNARIQNGTVDLGAYEGAVSVPGPKTIYVDLNATGANTGISWTDAFADVQSALLAATDGDTIGIAHGTYKPTSTTTRTISFSLRNAVAMYGGYAGYGASNSDARDIVAYPTILSGDIGVPGNDGDNSYHVVVVAGTDSTAVLDGFTITGGHANGSSDSGGGMDNYGSPTLTNCTFSGNSASNVGGGMCNEYSSRPTLTNCTFSGNSASSGGGMYNNNNTWSPTLTNCKFTGNSASSYGGGICNSDGSPTLTNCTFSGNSASSGGGMYNNNTSSPTLTNCTFSGNSASSGGGMYNSGSSGSPTLTNCTFSGNSASSGGGMYNFGNNPTIRNCAFSGNSSSSSTGGGGGMYNFGGSPTIRNCTFSGNTASYGGGGMYNSGGSPTLTNCTISGNSASSGAGMYNSSSPPTLTNCIVWGSGNSTIYNSSSTPVITYSDIQGGYTGTGNINADPLFVRSTWTGPDGVFATADDDYGDLRLRVGSPALNIGSNAAIPTGVTTDLAGNARIQGGRVDLGAYEGAISVPGPKTIYVDLNATGVNSGTSWTDAFTSIQSAILAATDGDSIRVADGTYKPTSLTDRTVSFVLKNAVAIYGGYAGYGATNPDARDIVAYATILSGDIGMPGNAGDNSYHVVVGTGITGTAMLDGFIISSGNASGTSPNDSGGGMYNSSGNPTIRNCTFSGNSASNYGGGMCSSGGGPTLG